MIGTIPHWVGMLGVLLSIAMPCAGQEDTVHWGVVNLSVCNLRTRPEYGAGMETQALLGMPVKILGHGGAYATPWPQIQLPDGYVGWVHPDAVTPMSHESLHAWNHAAQVVVTALFDAVYDSPSPQTRHTVSDVVSGDRLTLLGRKGTWFHVGFPDGRQGYLHTQSAREVSRWRSQLDSSVDAILRSATSLTGFPYLWAGTSVKGMDCSGFVRTVLLMHDILIPRDSGPQSRCGKHVDGWVNGETSLERGDLVFFGRVDSLARHVSHVGFYLGGGRFIHCLGKVKVGSFLPGDPLYDAYNTGRFLFGRRILPYIDQMEGLETTATNAFYAE